MSINNETTDSSSINSSFEIGLRALTILAVASPVSLDLQRLIYYDYLVIHTKDVGAVDSPPSLHPDTPHRSGGIIVRRKAMQKGLELMYSKSLINIIFDEKGISYSASELTKPFLDLFESTYSKKLQNNALWVVGYFSGYSEEEMKFFIERNIDNWGGEFMYEAFVRGGIE
ncbi:ABC-three component system middle component 2 [Brevibacillus laterosporus]|uniref:ABC-three component system middle component 2 n=1 Tax=Brevibacillus laterosporus TaxID=1465 RepID=UPI001EF2F459|nr:ABC-three component system middle component 2 [Brevibacillus laterosporus]MCG7317902.1 hypothetical protein [Brevibacillus laterosporus]